MQKYIRYLQNNSSLFYSLILLTLAIALFFGHTGQKYFGFEYEDAFISSHVASQPSTLEFLKYFRTNGCDLKINGSCQNTFSYPGHYISYSLYLKLISKVILVKESYLIHYYGNFILLLIIILFQFFMKLDKEDYWLSLLLVASLPAMYVLNSGLIENLSFTIGFLLVMSLKLYSRNEKWILVYFALLLLITIVKRENLIFLLTLGFFNIRHLLNKKSFWSFVGIFILIQLAINPFYTEGIESNALGRTTFSLEYLIFQLPTYLFTFFRPDGFLLISLSLLILIKPTKSSLVFLVSWIAFILVYAVHYRSQYAIASQSISHFETFRYMFNTLPLLFGVFIFGNKRCWKYKDLVASVVFVLVGISFFYYSSIIQEFKREENENYHMVNSKINKKSRNSKFQISIIDNFELISMINSMDTPINIYSTLQFKGVKEDGVYYLINRFNIIDIEDFETEKNVDLTKIDSLSCQGGNVYLVEMREKR